LYPKADYPNGHEDLSLGLNNLAAALNALGPTG